MQKKRRPLRLPGAIVIVLAMAALAAATAIVLPMGRQSAEETALPIGASRSDREASSGPSEQEVEGDWMHLSEIAWLSGTTGWVAIADEDLPSLDKAFDGAPLSIGGIPYEKGLGVFPLSEIVYELDGQYSTFFSEIGLNDLRPGRIDNGTSGVIFAVYADEALVYDSGVVRRGQLPSQVELPVSGVRQLRLVVTAAGAPSIRNTADWAGARLYRPVDGVDDGAMELNTAALRDQVANRQASRERDRTAVDDSSARQSAVAAEAFGALGSGPLETAVSPQPGQPGVALWNGVLLVSYGLGGEGHGQLTVWHAPSRQLLLQRAEASVTLSARRRLSLHYDTVPAGPDSYIVSEVADPVFGHGKRIEVFLTAKDGALDITFALTLYDRSPYFTQQVMVTRTTIPLAEARLRHVASLGSANLPLGESLRYLTDMSRLRSAVVADDGLQRTETVDQGKPVFLASEKRGVGLLLSVLDETTSPTEFSVSVDPGRVLGRLGLTSGRLVSGEPGTPFAGPRLYLEATGTTQPRLAFQNVRRFATQLYPPLPLPEWVRYQWLSWYVHYMDIDEGKIRAQIDYIAENLGDLGPWHVIVDAGWYVAEGRPGADWRNVDSDKFPSGLRALVDYAHSRDVKVVLYFSAPYVDGRTQQGDWLGLKGLVEAHPEWLIPIGDDENERSFSYNFDHPDLRAYMSDVMADFFEKYEVDGIKLDGLGNAQGSQLSPEQRNAFGVAFRLRQSTMDIYRFVHQHATQKPEVYIESGWLNPLFANGLAHTFRYGDESVDFSSRYPQPGLVEHIDYAVAQQSLWGQRANMGAPHDDPNHSEVNRQWLQAALALGAQSVLGFDLTAMTDATLSLYRSLLVHYRPFQGSTSYADVPGVDAFATTVDGTTYLGVLNRQREARSADLALAQFGLSPDQTYALYDIDGERLLSAQGSVRVELQPATFRLFLLRREPGAIWTNSSFRASGDGARNLKLEVKGPAHLAGFAEVYAPGLAAVSIDGRPLDLLEQERQPPPAVAEEARSGYTYDAQTGLLSLRYAHDRPHVVEIRLR